MMRAFTASYLGGVALALAAALLDAPGACRWLLWLQVPHLLLLFGMGWRLTGGQRVAAGLKLQVCGYAHTLISTMAHLMVVVHTVQSLTGSLGAALVGAILGWPLGRELISSGEAAVEQGCSGLGLGTTVFDPLSGRVGRQLSAALERWSEEARGVTKATAALEVSVTRLTSRLDETTGQALKLQQSSQGLTHQMKTAGEEVRAAAGQLTSAAKDLTQLSESAGRLAQGTDQVLSRLLDRTSRFFSRGGS